MNQEMHIQKKQKWLLGILITLFFVLQFQLWIGKGSLLEVSRYHNEIEAQNQENQQLVKRNTELEMRIKDLRSHPEAVEELARTRLGMVKKDEAFFFTIKQK